MNDGTDSQLVVVPNVAEVVLNYSPSDDNRIAAFNMAENLKSIFHFYTPAGKTSSCWVYQADKGIWVPRGEELIEEIVTRSMSEFFRSRIVSEVVRKIRNDTRDESVILGRMTSSRIVMANGVFDMNNCTFSSEFNPDDYQLMALSYEYDTKADCPRFRQFLEEVCPNEEDRLALIEFMGYCLIHHHRIHTFIVLVGSGENGKSKFCGTLIEMLGKENITGMTIQQLAHDNFMAASLLDKLANICPDIPDSPINSTGKIKALTGEDLIQVQKKHHDNFTLQNHAKLLFSANQIPVVANPKDAWFRRVRIIEFPNQFLLSDERRDENLGEKLAAEVQGIFNLAVEGWQRLKAQGRLTGAKSTEMNRTDYLKRSNPLQYFVYRYCKPDLESKITVNATFHCYKRVSINLGKVPISKNWFSTRLLDLLENVESRQMKIAGKNTRVYVGLRIDLDLLSKDMGNDEHGISLHKDGTLENIVYIMAKAVFAVADPDQASLTPNGDPARPQPPLPQPSLYKIWSSQDLDYGLPIDFDTLNEKERKTIGIGVESGYVGNDPKGEHGPSTYSLTARGLNACEALDAKFKER